MSQPITFDGWVFKLRKLALKHGHILDVANLDSYREYYDDGDSPEEALAAEMREPSLCL